VCARQTAGKDLKLKFDRLGADLVAENGDLQTVSEEENIAQAIVHRLSTEEGELDDIGHADYGSRLYQIVGEPNSEETRSRIRNVVEYALSQDPRIKEVTGINVKTDPREPSVVSIEITILPEEGSPLTVVYPFGLEAE